MALLFWNKILPKKVTVIIVVFAHKLITLKNQPIPLRVQASLLSVFKLSDYYVFDTKLLRILL